MSWSVAKMITSGMLGLNSSGLALYFGPQLFQDSEGSPIYKTSDSDDSMFSDRKWFEFSEQEKAIFNNLKEELSKFSKALKKLGQSKSTENQNILQHFSKTQQAEQELQSLYEENKNILEEMKRISQLEHDASSKKLQTEEILKKLEFYVNSLKNTSSVMHGWGESIKEFICAIENVETSKCKEKSSKWYIDADSKSTAELSQQVATTGGGTGSAQGENGKAAMKQLEESKQKLNTELKNLRSKFWDNLIAFWTKSSEKNNVSELKTQIEKALENLKANWAKEKRKLDESVSKSQEKVTELNKFYEDLKTSYSKWEKIKQFESEIHTYKGVMESLLRENLFGRKDSSESR